MPATPLIHLPPTSNIQRSQKADGECCSPDGFGLRSHIHRVCRELSDCYTCAKSALLAKLNIFVEIGDSYLAVKRIERERDIR